MLLGFWALPLFWHKFGLLPVEAVPVSTGTSSTLTAAEFIVQLELAPLALTRPGIAQNQLEHRLESACQLALSRALASHFFGGHGALLEGQRRIGTTEVVGTGLAGVDTAEGAPPFRVRVLGWESPTTARPTPRLRFAASIHGHPVNAQALVRDLSLLSLAELSALLQLPVVRLNALAQTAVAEQAQWWIIGLVLAGGLFVIGCGWALLVCWLNLCVRRQPPPAGNVTTVEGQREEEATQVPSATELESTQKELRERPTASVWRRPKRLPFGSRKRQRTTGAKRKTNEKASDGSKREEARPTDSDENVTAKQTADKEDEAEQQQKQPTDVVDTRTEASSNEAGRKSLELKKDSDHRPEVYTIGRMSAADRQNPYWAADQLERIFHISTLPSAGHPRPAPPTEDGELRFGFPQLQPQTRSA